MGYNSGIRDKKECVAVFIDLYRNTVTVSCVGSYFLSDWTLRADRGGDYTGMPSQIRLPYGQLQIETATHSL